MDIVTTAVHFSCNTFRFNLSLHSAAVNGNILIPIKQEKYNYYAYNVNKQKTSQIISNAKYNGKI